MGMGEGPRSPTASHHPLSNLGVLRGTMKAETAPTSDSQRCAMTWPGWVGAESELGPDLLPLGCFPTTSLLLLLL